DWAEAAKKIDERGFDTLWTWDHFYPLYGVEGAPLDRPLPRGVDPNRLGDHFEAWTLLTALACITKKVDIGLLVSCNSYRNSNLLADMARTIDHISHGRLIFGIGSGWYEKDYQEYGYEFGTAVGRLKDLEKSLPVIKERWSKLKPAPVRSPIPIMIGGGGEKFTLRLVAEHAHQWNGVGPPDLMAHKNRVLDQWCEKVGRDPASIERSVALTTPDTLDNLDQYYQAGMRHFILAMGAPFDFEHADRLLEWKRKRS
ncbi:MAG: LLM class F420-dependent oxidoreductase, partial [Candidatus Eremiobacteraeota bacterium]|nr:LLM class F420-dependent oxidoreductase [Candidatus Eremiobacteraeota bacterium]